MFERNLIDLPLKKYLTVHNSLPPKIYGLPKIHTQNVPLRPVVCFVKSPLYSSSQFISRIISSIRDDSRNTRSSKNVVQKLSDIQLDADDVFVSFDVVSMYTNINL